MKNGGDAQRRTIATREGFLAAAAIVGFTIVVTWPQCLHMWTRVASHDDPLFSIWRLSWVAHALASDPRHLFDANIFYPAKRALAFSDAMILEGSLAAPLLWATVSPVAVYNFLLLGGIAASGLAMFVLARHLLGATLPALVSAAVFTMAPYRIEHFMHLELQWTMWVPLALWAYYRAAREGSWRLGLLGGLFMWLQVLASVYYGVFLAMSLAVFVPMSLAMQPRRVRPALAGIAGGIVLAAILTLPYAVPYLKNAAALGPRAVDEVARYSARPYDYLASPPQNWVWGGPPIPALPNAGCSPARLRSFSPQQPSRIAPGVRSCPTRCWSCSPSRCPSG